MFNGFLEYAGVEVINAARVRKYIETFLPHLSMTCESGGLLTALGDTSYVSPAADNAPWYRATRPATARFYGLFPGELIGAEDSSRSVSKIELTGDGATHAKPRYAAREIKITALALAADEEAMNEGLAWLRDIMATGECGNAGGCSDNDMKMYAARPAAGLADNHLLRTFIRVEVLDNVKVVKTFSSPRHVAKRITVIFSAGKPWAFTPKLMAGNIMPDTGATFTDPAGEDCYATNNAFTDFVNDPFYTAIAKPPQPPIVKPPNVADVSTWKRRTLPLPQAEVDRHGRVTPVVTVAGGAGGVVMLRLRFYGDGVSSGCGFEGEFLISYMPANSTMVLDAMRQDIKLILANGRTVPGGHLVYGSGGLPPKWPSLGCNSTYTLIADLLPGQTGVTVYLETAVRE